MEALVHALGIQWSALIAQAVNFLILLFILSRFVYRPILKVIDDRRALVAESVRKAEEIDRHAALLDQERSDKLKKTDEKIGAMLGQAKVDAEAIRTEIVKEANTSAAQTLEKGRQKLLSERAQMIKDLQQKLAHTIIHSAEKILKREFSKEDQAEMEADLEKALPTLLA